MQGKWLIITGIWGSISLQPVWAWTVPIENSCQTSSQPSASQEVLTKEEVSDDMLVAEPLPQVKPEWSKKEPRPSENKVSHRFKKQPAHLTEEEQVTLNYVQALEYINKGINAKAEGLLLKNLSILPSHFVSRLELANLYLKADQDLDAEHIVNEGLQQQQHPEWLKLMALIMERRGELKLALDYLNKIPPHYKNDKNTVVLLGHLYQQTGHFSLAKKQYDRLLEAEPNHPLWVLGMAMALEGQGNKREALKNYLQLQSNPALDSSLSQYVSERIASLKG